VTDRSEANRFEFKFLIRQQEYQSLKERLIPFLGRDPHEDSQGGYRVTSLYFDTDDFACFWEKVDGLLLRKKVRLRTYGESSESGFIEIKQRLDNTVQKKRVQLPLADLEAFAFNMPEYIPKDAISTEAYCIVRANHMSPKMLITYDREAFHSIYEPNLRITFDHNLRFSATDLRWASIEEHHTLLLYPAHGILEIKANNTVPSWLLSFINHQELQIERLSKYCLAVNQSVYAGTVF
jgi:SPX domain protein involved in polyphosphate accumulation